MKAQLRIKVRDFYGNEGQVLETLGNSVRTTINPNLWYHITKLMEVIKIK